MRRVLRSLLCLSMALLVLVLLSPWLLYEWGLLQLDSLPVRPAQMASAEQQARVWQYVRAPAPQQVERLNPYGYVWTMFDGPAGLPPSERLAAWVARDHVINQPRRGNLTRHCAEAALMIWLTRHWSAEELAAAAVPIVDRDLKYRARRAAEAAREDQAPSRSRAASAM